MTKIKKPWLLVLSIAVCQLAGIVGSIFTTSAIPTWYVNLIKPSFTPPAWLFGPVWILLYLLMGIALYRITIKGLDKSGVGFAVRIFVIHLVLNAFWSIIFFGAKNIGAAFYEIIILWAIILYIVSLFWKIDKMAAYLLLPYFLWVSFAAVLNFAIWNLNPQKVYAQEFDYNKAYQDYEYQKDVYKVKYSDFIVARSAYRKNKTLSLKEEARVALFNFLLTRNDFQVSYLTAVRMRVVEMPGLDNSQKESIYTALDDEVSWFRNYKQNYGQENTVEDLLQKSRQEDSHMESVTIPVVNFSLSNISLGDTEALRVKHEEIYQNLKLEAENLVVLGRADLSLFERWFKDTGEEMEKLMGIESRIKSSLANIFEVRESAQRRQFTQIQQSFSPARSSLLQINKYLFEFENTIDTKR